MMVSVFMITVTVVRLKTTDMVSMNTICQYYIVTITITVISRYWCEILLLMLAAGTN